MGAQDFEGLVSLYHGIFLYCGIAAILFLVAAILLFIFLKIPRVFSELTGRVAKKAIAQMSEDGAASGDLNTSRRIGDDGRRHRKGRTGALGTSKLRRKSGSLSGGLTTEKMARSGRMEGVSGELGGMMSGAQAAGVGTESYSGGMGAGALANSGAPVQTFSSAPAQSFAASAGYLSDDSGSAPTDVLSSGYGTSGSLSGGMNSPGAIPPGMDDRSAPTDVLSSGPAMVQSAGGSWSDAGAAAQTETMVLGGGPGGFVVLRTIMEVHTDEVI